MRMYVSDHLTFSRFIRKKLKTVQSSFVAQRRDTRYVFVLALSLIVFVLSGLQAFDTGLFDSLERPLFDAINNLPNQLERVMRGITQFGGLSSLIFWLAVAWFMINARAALTVGLAGTLGWFLAKVAKVLIARGRPGDLLETVQLFGGEKFGGYGFPSGHSTFAAACATVLYFQVDRKYRKYILLVVFLVGFSRMYLGAHFPLDVVGGWALGALVGATLSLLFGISRKGITVRRLKTVLAKKGYPMKHLKFADVDARGSRPIIMTDVNGKEYFAKIFGVQEHAADWLFKIYRFFRYKNLQAEEPYINSRRNVEMESFATLWAKQAGVRVSTIVDVIKLGSSWMLIQERLDAKTMSEHGNVRQKSLVDAWKQVSKLHAANMAHRDLRAANLMIDKKGAVWIIDFGFAEVSSKKQRQYMDIAELLMSMSLVVGVKRTIDAVIKVIPRDRLQRVLPYLKREVFSGATAKQIKANKHMLDELKSTLVEVLDIEDNIDEADIIRLNTRKVLNIALIGAFIYIIIPQFSSFKGVLQSLAAIDSLWIIPMVAASIGTYILTGLVYVILANVPIKLLPTSLIQLAASFISKIVPSGIGNTSLNIRYLSRSGMDKVDASAVIVTNNIISIVMFVVPLSLFLLVMGESLSSIILFRLTYKQIFFVVSGLTIVLLILINSRKLRNRLQSAVSQFVTSIREFTNSPFEVALASLSSLAISLCYVICLYACFRAVGVAIGLASTVIVFVSAIIAKSVAPTPGGLGPFEIAMVSTILSLGIARPEALSVVVLYRLVTFWLPIPFSLLAYRYISDKKLI